MAYILILYGLTWISYKLTFHNILAPTFQTWFYNNVNWMQNVKPKPAIDLRLTKRKNKVDVIFVLTYVKQHDMRPINHFTWLRLKYVSESNMWQQDEHLCLGLQAAAKYHLQFFASWTNFCIHWDFPPFSLLFTKLQELHKDEMSKMIMECTTFSIYLLFYCS